MLLVAGFDPGIRRAGYAFLDEQLHVQECGLVKIPSTIDRRKIKGEEALSLMIARLCHAIWPSPSLVVVEGQDHFRGSKVHPMDVTRLGMVSGAFAGRLGAPSLVASPSAWTGGIGKRINQNRILARSGVTREEVMQMAECTEVQSSEAVDAIGLAQWGWKIARSDPSLIARIGR
jgi:hypothetical protein